MKMPLGKKIAFFGHDVNDDDLHVFIFKLACKKDVRRVFAALKEEGVMCDFKIEKRKEVYRTEYVHTGWTVTLTGFVPDDPLPVGTLPPIRLDDVYRMINEMFFACGYDELRCVSLDRIMNLKITY